MFVFVVSTEGIVQRNEWLILLLVQATNKTKVEKLNYTGEFISIFNNSFLICLNINLFNFGYLSFIHFSILILYNRYTTDDADVL